MTDRDRLQHVLTAFGQGRLKRAVQISSGHIHATYRLTSTTGTSVAQALNPTVFTDLTACEGNLRRIGDHLAHNDRIRVPYSYQSATGSNHWVDEDAVVWRLTEFVNNTRTILRAADIRSVHAASFAFGTYLSALADLGDPPLVATIHRFHDIAHRQQQLATAITSNVCGRLTSAERLVVTLDELGSGLADALLHLDAFELLPVHNDAKVANVRFNKRLTHVSHVLDLDTTMPGLALFDIGELLRSATASTPEDATDPTTIVVRPSFVAAVINGFSTGAGAAFSQAERDLLPDVAAIMAFENALRMLTDYLDGDVYFPATSPTHNLVRARAQVEIARQLIELRPTID